MTGGPWTWSMKVVHGPGPKRGSMDPWSMFCPHPCVTANMKAIRPLRSLQLHDYVFILQSEITNVLDGLLLIYWRNDILS